MAHTQGKARLNAHDQLVLEHWRKLTDEARVVVRPFLTSTYELCDEQAAAKLLWREGRHHAAVVALAELLRDTDAQPAASIAAATTSTMTTTATAKTTTTTISTKSAAGVSRKPNADANATTSKKRPAPLVKATTMSTTTMATTMATKKRAKRDGVKMLSGGVINLCDDDDDDDDRNGNGGGRRRGKRNARGRRR